MATRRLKSGTTYLLERRGSRSVKMNLIVAWKQPSSRGTGKEVRHYIFSLGLRQAAKLDKKTAPKLALNRAYVLARTGGDRFCVWLYRQKVGWGRRRILWFNRVKPTMCKLKSRRDF
jgi:hypothetical protein